MYLNFYGLRENPFNATPDPKFLYLTPGHREALAQLLYAVQEKKGFIVLTGEVGTGKTTLLQALRQRLDGNAAVAFIHNSTLPFDGILEYMLGDFGIAWTRESQAQRLFAINDFLVERCRGGQNAVLILDEAQNLDPSTLEQVRLLSNFETPTEKLLQILLVGQPELRSNLQLPQLRQLKQRIALRCSISPLTPKQTPEYIRSRLRVAGAREAGLFTDRAMSRIAEYAGGVPRVVNNVCDHCLLFGYADQKRRIERDTVEQAIEYLEEERSPRRRQRGLSQKRGMTPFRWAVGALVAALLGEVAMLALYPAALGNVSSRVATYLFDLARSARELLVR